DTRATSSSRERVGRRPNRDAGCRVLFYRSVGPLPGRPLPADLPLRTTHGPLLRDLRQGLDGRLQPAVVGDEPRSSPPPHAAESPAPPHRREGHAYPRARLHTLPPNPA